MTPFSEIWCAGGAHLDMIGRAAGPLSTAGSTPGRARTGFGGVALNVARSLSAAGLRVALTGAAGGDPTGAALRAHLATHGLLDRLIPTVSTGAYVVIEDETGAFVYAVADLTPLEAIPPAQLAATLSARPQGAALLLDGNLTEDQLDAVAAPPGPVIAVAVSAVKAPRLRRFPPRLDVLFCNLAEAEVLTGEAHSTTREAAKALAALGLGTVCVTNGPAPAALIDGDALAEAAPAPLAAATSTGAGDALAAAVLAALSRGAAADAALDEGLRAAARIVKGE